VNVVPYCWTAGLISGWCMSELRYGEASSGPSTSRIKNGAPPRLWCITYHTRQRQVAVALISIMTVCVCVCVCVCSNENAKIAQSEMIYRKLQKVRAICLVSLRNACFSKKNAKNYTAIASMLASCVLCWLISVLCVAQ